MICAPPLDFEARRKQARARSAVRTMEEAASHIRQAAKLWRESEVSADLDVALVLSLAVEHIGNAVDAARAKVEP